jgi:hypothetical protein
VSGTHDGRFWIRFFVVFGGETKECTRIASNDLLFFILNAVASLRCSILYPNFELRYEIRGISKLSKSIVNINAYVSNKINIYKLARYHFKESNKDLRHVI